MGKSLQPLSEEQHRLAADLVNHVQDNLHELARLVATAKGAAYVDEALRVQRTIQGRLIDPLRESWDATLPVHDNPYQSIGYSPGSRRRMPR